MSNAAALTRRSFLLSAVVDGVGPYIVFLLAESHASEPEAIALSMLPPFLSNVVTVARRRRFDYIGIIVLAGLMVGFGLYLLGGSPRLILVRDSLISGAIGVVFLASLALRRPLVFYIARQLAAGNSRDELAAWNAAYDRSRTKYGLPLITLAWGLVLAAEAVLRTVMAFSLPVRHYLIVSPIINFGMYIGMLAWSFSYARAMRRREMATETERRDYGAA